MRWPAAEDDGRVSSPRAFVGILHVLFLLMYVSNLVIFSLFSSTFNFFLIIIGDFWKTDYIHSVTCQCIHTGVTYTSMQNTVQKRNRKQLPRNREKKIMASYVHGMEAVLPCIFDFCRRACLRRLSCSRTAIPAAKGTRWSWNCSEGRRYDGRWCSFGPTVINPTPINVFQTCSSTLSRGAEGPSPSPVAEQDSVNFPSPISNHAPPDFCQGEIIKMC